MIQIVRVQRTFSTILPLLIPLVLSTVTHLWNPVGFPAIFSDEDVYIKRAFDVLNDFNLQSWWPADHPFFGWLFLATVFALIDYPDSIVNTAALDAHSVEMLYLVPRVLMGMIAIVDTFLVFKICENRYNKSIAFIASILFAVMPLTWITRYILLDTIQLPFILSSILFALYATGSKKAFSLGTRSLINAQRFAFMFPLLSGIFLGLAIFTKIPAIAMMPIVAYLIFSNIANRRLKILGVWIAPVFMIPLIWPLNAIYLDELGSWMEGISSQTQRQFPLFDWLGWYPGQNSLELFFRIDPVLMILGLAGLIFAIVARDRFLLLWITPFLAFEYFIGYVFFFHLIPLFPAFCVAIARLIKGLSNRIVKYDEIRRIVPYAAITALGIFGLVSTTMLIVTNINATHIAAASFLATHLPMKSEQLSIFRGEYRFIWIFNDMMHNRQFYYALWDTGPKPVSTEPVVLMLDGGFDLFKYWMGVDEERIREMIKQCDEMNLIAEFEHDAAEYDFRKYPYTSMILPMGLGAVEMRANDEAVTRYFNDSVVSLQPEPCEKSIQTSYDISTDETILHRLILRPFHDFIQNWIRLPTSY